MLLGRSLSAGGKLMKQCLDATEGRAVAGEERDPATGMD